MKSLEIRGAGGGDVTGSQFLLTGNKDDQYLVDCGMSQGNNKDNPRSSDLDPTKLKGIFITHAHIDHVGLVQLLAKHKNIPVFMTPATYAISDIALRNSAKLSPWLFPPGSIEEIKKRSFTVPYGRRFKINGASAEFNGTGHILGAASVVIQENGDKIAFSGDIGNKFSKTVKPTEHINDADIVVLESTYGGVERPVQDPKEDLKEAIYLIKSLKSTLIIPAFAIDRTQAVLSILRELSEEHFLKGVKVFLDSPMASDVTRVYQGFRNLLNDDLATINKPFVFQELRETPKYSDSLRIDKQKNPKIIIAGSGMLSGGRIVRHVQTYLTKEDNVILFVGFAAPGTPSEKIVRGDRNVHIEGEDIEINSQILRTSLSAHADHNGLLDWLEYPYMGQRSIRNVIVVHGENKNRHSLAGAINEKFDLKTTIPDRGDIVSFC